MNTIPAPPVDFVLESDHSALSGKRVFLVEEDRYLCNALKRMLEDAGCELLGGAQAVSEGTSLIPSGHMDVALIDLPRDARLYLSLASQLSERGIPIVLIAYDLAGKLPRQLQPHQALTKPFTERELLDRMVKAVE